ncbi:MAG: hypothetical protein R2794_11955 [Chitinophagales bacterium]
MLKPNTIKDLSAQDYYPFGMVMPGRSFTAGGAYRYGFNGQEQDDEIAGNGDFNTAEFWEYDTRLGKRWNMDPIVISNISPYTCFNNSPILYSDVDGNYSKKRAEKMRSKAEKYGYSTGNVYKVGEGKNDYGFNITVSNYDETGIYTTTKFKGSTFYSVMQEKNLILYSTVNSDIPSESKDKQQSNLTIAMVNATYGFQHSWDGALNYVGTESADKYGPFVPDAIGITIPLYLINNGYSISFVLGPDGIQTYASYYYGIGNDASLGFSFDMYDIENPSNWRDEISSGLTQNYEGGFGGFSIGYSQSSDYDMTKVGLRSNGKVKKYSIGLSAGTDQLPSGIINGKVMESRTTRIGQRK